MKRKVINAIIISVGIIAFTLLASALYGCSKEVLIFGPHWEEYTVKAGQHSPPLSQRGLRPMYDKHSLDVECEVNHTWLWPNVTPTGWSKLWGISQGISHKDNSARIGIRVLDGVITIGLYVRRNGQHYAKPLFTAQVGQNFICRLSLEHGYWVLRSGMQQVSIQAGPAADCNYFLYPYVGGEYTLPFDWNVKFKILN